ncbi:unnamed protein product [Caenorhabditis auriculariae]|uniref:Apple domain-containing protein n=1 Tax=Caenorhabditis auriculariae TaxID=2777116 RepID=A0A8S1HLR0_9PELO|nr:unnamed protein product [Caenorhabditis auriculariae]
MRLLLLLFMAKGAKASAYLQIDNHLPTRTGQIVAYSVGPQIEPILNKPRPTCQFDEKQWLHKLDFGVSTLNMFERRTGSSCEQCLRHCAARQGGKFSCRSIVFDQKWMVCDLYSMSSEPSLAIIPMIGKDYFEFLLADQPSDDEEIASLAFNIDERKRVSHDCKLQRQAKRRRNKVNGVVTATEANDFLLHDLLYGTKTRGEKLPKRVEISLKSRPTRLIYKSGTSASDFQVSPAVGVDQKTLINEANELATQIEQLTNFEAQDFSKLHPSDFATTRPTSSQTTPDSFKLFVEQQRAEEILKRKAEEEHFRAVEEKKKAEQERLEREKAEEEAKLERERLELEHRIREEQRVKEQQQKEERRRKKEERRKQRRLEQERLERLRVEEDKRRFQEERERQKLEEERVLQEKLRKEEQEVLRRREEERLEKLRIEEEERQKLEKQRFLEEERQRQEQVRLEKLRLEAIERQKKEEEQRRQELERLEKLRIEFEREKLEKQRRLEEERLLQEQKKLEKMRLEAEERQQKEEELRRLEVERLEKLKKEEEQRKKLEEVRLQNERQRQVLEEKARQEHERMIAEKERLRMEKQRLEEEKQQKILEEKRRVEEERHRLEMERFEKERLERENREKERRRLEAEMEEKQRLEEVRRNQEQQRLEKERVEEERRTVDEWKEKQRQNMEERKREEQRLERIRQEEYQKSLAEWRTKQEQKKLSPSKKSGGDTLASSSKFFNPPKDDKAAKLGFGNDADIEDITADSFAPTQVPIFDPKNALSTTTKLRPTEIDGEYDDYEQEERLDEAKKEHDLLRNGEVQKIVPKQHRTADGEAVLFEEPVCGSREVPVMVMFAGSLMESRQRPLVGEVKWRPAVTTAQCMNLCKMDDDCMSANFSPKGCELSLTRWVGQPGEQLRAEKRSSYLEKICLFPIDIAGEKVEVFAEVHKAQVGSVIEVEDAISMDECVTLCLRARRKRLFDCKSAMWYPDDKSQNCLLNTENRHTRPDMYVAQKTKVIYFEIPREDVQSHGPFKLMKKDSPLPHGFTTWSKCNDLTLEKTRYRKCKEQKDVRKCPKEIVKCEKPTKKAAVPGKRRRLSRVKHLNVKKIEKIEEPAKISKVNAKAENFDSETPSAMMRGSQKTLNINKIPSNVTSEIASNSTAPSQKLDKLLS